MGFPGKILTGAAALAALVLAFQSGRAGDSQQAPRQILGVYGVGGVIGADGTLWQYLPDRKKWLTIDAAFLEEGRETQILPLPVAATQIQFMESWGFLVSREGQVWHYDLNSNRWENIGTPPVGQ